MSEKATEYVPVGNGEANVGREERIGGEAGSEVLVEGSPGV